MLFNFVTALVISDIVAITYLLYPVVLLILRQIILSMQGSFKLNSANILPIHTNGAQHRKNAIWLQLVYYNAQKGGRGGQYLL